MAARRESVRVRYVPPPPDSLRLRDAWKLFYEHYWTGSKPLPPRPEGMALKILDRSNRPMGSILYNPRTGCYFVIRFRDGEKPRKPIDSRRRKFPIRYQVKDLDQVVLNKGVLMIDLKTAEPVFDSQGVELPSGTIDLPADRECRIELLPIGAPKNFTYSHRQGWAQQSEPAGCNYLGGDLTTAERPSRSEDILPEHGVYTPEQHAWDNHRYDRVDEPTKAFAAAFRSGELTAFVCYPNMEQRNIEPHAWGVERADEDLGDGYWARRLMLMNDDIPENDLPYLKELNGLIPYVPKKHFERWLPTAKRHQPSQQHTKVGADDRILESNRRLFEALKLLKITWPPKRGKSDSGVASEIHQAENARKIEAIGWHQRIIRAVLGGKHEPSNRLAEAGKLPRWWLDGQWPANLPEK